MNSSKIKTPSKYLIDKIFEHPIYSLIRAIGDGASNMHKSSILTILYGLQRITRLQALKSYTIDNAYAAFEEDIKGSLEVGKLADITVLSNDIMTVPEDQILSTKVVYTILGGDVKYDSNESTILMSQ